MALLPWVIVGGVFLIAVALVWWDDHRNEWDGPEDEVEVDGGGAGGMIVETGLEIGLGILGGG